MGSSNKGSDPPLLDPRPFTRLACPREPEGGEPVASEGGEPVASAPCESGGIGLSAPVMAVVFVQTKRRPKEWGRGRREEPEKAGKKANNVAGVVKNMEEPWSTACPKKWVFGINRFGPPHVPSSV